MVNPHDASEVVPYLTSAVTIVYIQKWMKRQPAYQRFVEAFPGAGAWAHWLVAGVMSFFAASGIHVVWNWNMDTGGTFSGTLPNLTTLVHAAADWWKVYILQHFGQDISHQPAFATIVAQTHLKNATPPGE